MPLSPPPAAPSQSALAAWAGLATPEGFYRFAGRSIPWFTLAATLLGVAGLYVGFAVAPVDPRQGEVHRIAYLHVPTAAMSVFLYGWVVAWAAVGAATGSRLPSMMALALAPTGAVCTFIALWTGAIWGKPTGGTWWSWDAALTAELVLLAVYLAFLALHAAIDDPRRADRASAVVAFAGAAAVAATYASLRWGSDAPQEGFAALEALPGDGLAILAGMAMTAGAMWMYAFAISFARVRCVILEREAAA